MKPKKKSPSKIKYGIEYEKKQKSLGNIKVLGKTIDVYEDLSWTSGSRTNFISIGHSDKQIICNELFTLLDKKIQTFAISMVLSLLEEHTKNIKNGVSDRQMYLNADKKAFLYSIKRYPKTPKVFWMYALRIFVEGNLSELNFNRVKNLFNLLKSKKDKADSKKAVANYSKKLKDCNWRKNAELKNLSKVEEATEADTITLKYPKKKLAKQMKDLEKKGYKSQMFNTSIVISPNTKAQKRKGWKNTNPTPIELTPIKSILMRSKSKTDMVRKVEVLYPEYKIIKKGNIKTVEIKGYPKYSQPFTLALKTIKPKVVVTEYRNGKKVTPKKN